MCVRQFSVRGLKRHSQQDQSKITSLYAEEQSAEYRTRHNFVAIINEKQRNNISVVVLMH